MLALLTQTNQHLYKEININNFIYIGLVDGIT